MGILVQNQENKQNYGEPSDLLPNISTAAIYLKAIPDKIINEMNPAQKETIVKFLTGLIERMKQ